jgi:hypothetical protein
VSARREARALQAAERQIKADAWGGSDPEPDSEGNQRWYEAELASQHLASLSPERRAQLERESWA